MSKNEKTKLIPFEGRSCLLRGPDNTQTQTITIEAYDSEDLIEVTENTSRARQEEKNARSRGKPWRNFGNGNNKKNNFDGDVVNNSGNAVGNIFNGKDAVNKSSANTNGSIICDEISSASNDGDWEDFGNGKNNSNDFGGRVVNNYGRKPRQKLI